MDLHAVEQDTKEQGWVQWLEDQLAVADSIVIVCTEHLRAAYDGDMAEDGRPESTWEALLAIHLHNPDTRYVDKVVVVQFDDSGPSAVPCCLKSRPYYRLYGEYKLLHSRLFAAPNGHGAGHGAADSPVEPLDPLPVLSVGLPPSLEPRVRALPTPRYQSERTRALGTMLQQASLRRHQFVRAGRDLANVDYEIAVLKNLLRMGGALTAGDVLGNGRYLLLSQIGSNDFSAVWQALDYWTLSTVAIKVLHEQAAQNPVRIERFIHSAYMMTVLEHRAVVNVLESAGRDGGVHFFTMEYLSGGSLSRAVRDHRIVGEEGAIHMLTHIGGALAEAHERGYVHRDVKPENILLSARDELQLIDFDLASTRHTGGNTHTGPMAYMVYAPPELWDDPHSSDARIDVYGLAMTAIYVLHGEDLPHSIVRHPGQFVNTLSCRTLLKQVLIQAVDENPANRFEHAAALCGAVRAAVRDDENTGERKAYTPGARGSHKGQKTQRVRRSSGAGDIPRVFEVDKAQDYFALHRLGRRGFVSQVASAALIRPLPRPLAGEPSGSATFDVIPPWGPGGPTDTATPYPPNGPALSFELTPVMKKFGSFHPDRVTVGRHPERDIVLFHQTVSRTHSYFTYQQSRWHIHDEGSRHGTYVGGIRLRKHRDRKLESGDLLRFGGVELFFFHAAELYTAIQSFAGLSLSSEDSEISLNLPSIVLGVSQREVILELLEQCASMSNADMRNELRQLLPAVMRSRLGDSGTPRVQALAIIRCCIDYNGFAHLCRALHVLEGDTIHYHKLIAHLRQRGLIRDS